MSHTPVLLKEVIEILKPAPGEFFIDGTVGGGGHATEIMKKISPKGVLLGVDVDENTIKRLKEKFGNKRLETILFQGNYADLPKMLKNHKLGRADGLLLDLGFSSEHLESGRGFTFLKNEKLDMRYSPVKNSTAEEIVNNFGEKDLSDIFWQYGGEKYSRRIARNIVEERKVKPIKTTFDFVRIIEKSVPKNYERGRLHKATRCFQALRIYVNNELGNLEKLLKNLHKILKNHSRAAIISYHSLEDRLVKNYFREMDRKNLAKILTKKPITPTLEEIKSNYRSRSAKLRAVQFI